MPIEMAKRLTPLQQRLLGYRCYDDGCYYYDYDCYDDK